MSDDQLIHRVPFSSWMNWHETVTSPVKGAFKLAYPPGSPPYDLPTMKRCTSLVKTALARAKAEGGPIRAVGTAWSLSSVPATKGWLVDITNHSALRPLAPAEVDAGYPGTADERAGLWLLNGGTYIGRINRVIERDAFRRSLNTSGAANGQTIAGAISTGTHGSRLGYPALHDTVVALHLLAGPDREIWLERASRPVVASSFVAALGAELIRDDELYDAAVLGLGAFGVIVNLVLETRPRMLLGGVNLAEDAAGKPLLFDTEMRKAIADLDFGAHPALRDPQGRTPYFFQPIIDPNTNPHQLLVTLLYEEPWTSHTPDYTLAEQGFGPGYDFLTTAGRLLDIFRPAVPLFAQIAQSSLFTAGPVGPKTWGELFGNKVARTKVASGSVAVERKHALRTLDALIALNKAAGGVPVVFGCRYVAQSRALLAMNRWPETFVISVDGVWNKATAEFLDAIPATMAAKGIPFTQHWGKVNGGTPARVLASHGANVGRWIAARHKLMPDPVDRAMFTNDYMRERGLDL